MFRSTTHNREFGYKVHIGVALLSASIDVYVGAIEFPETCVRFALVPFAKRVVQNFFFVGLVCSGWGYVSSGVPVAVDGIEKSSAYGSGLCSLLSVAVGGIEKSDDWLYLVRNFIPLHSSCVTSSSGCRVVSIGSGLSSLYCIV